MTRSSSTELRHHYTGAVFTLALFTAALILG